MPAVHVENFTYGLLNPALGYLMSCLGAFIGLRCLTRARVYSGGHRALWLALAAVAIGATGIWAMHFIAMLGYTIPGQTITYNVPLTIVSMLVAVTVVAIGLFIVGFSKSQTLTPLLIGGVIVGLGVASMHYLGMEAINIPDMMNYNALLVALSVIIAIGAGTAALYAGLKVRGIGATLGASALMGVAVSGMHYTGMAAMTVFASSSAGVYAAGAAGSGATATSFLLPLVLGISVFTFLATIVVMLAPSEADIVADAQLAKRLAERPISHHRR
ncbi:MAG TPA: MHYT domain-containing protein [Streptosporangiaceae bacterium]|jgi:NO-binding membrane sensor protein with MHYT domain